ncbi:uncharacterized protein [Apostichopus japonicus]
MDTLLSTPDIYSGIHLSSKDIKSRNLEEFGKRLKESLGVWSSEGVRGVWIKIFLKDADLVGEVAKHGFKFHHAQENYVMMTRWLPQTEPNMLPSFANHYIGVGGLVINSKNQILVIQELYSTSPRRWKLPGGAVDKGEFLSKAVVREVREETGIDSEFQSVHCFRHLPNFRYKQSDFYFVCLLKPLTETIKHCRAEIAACQWMDMDDFLANDEVYQLNKKVVLLYREKLGGINLLRSDQYELYSTEKTLSALAETTDKPKS